MNREPEIWKPVTIEPFEGRYMISSYGQVKRLESRKAKKEFILTQHIANKYLAVTLCCDWDITKQIKAHRLVALHYVDNPHNYTEINHLDGNKFNNYYKNLEWCTHSQNISHAFTIGILNTQGSKNGQSKLTEKDIISMRKAYVKEMSKPSTFYRGRKLKGFSFAKDIAKKYKMSAAYIYSILLNECWTHVK